MKKFLIKISITLTLVVSVHVVTVLIFANGKIDDFYLRFTVPKQHSLVMGSSRAAQGVVPAVLNEELEGPNLKYPVFNFSFTVFSSLYGPYYLESIKRKLSPDTKDGLFILAVDPWSVSNPGDLDADEFNERGTFPYNVRYSSMNPNFEYLIKNYRKGWGRMIIVNSKPIPEELHSDGWLEIKIKLDTAKRAKRVQERVKKYYDMYFSTREFSPARLAHLKETISYLKNYGTVCMVRIPIDSKMLELEREFLPEFDELIEQTAKEKGVVYFNYSHHNGTYVTNDGNHLARESALEFTKQLAEDIKTLYK